MRFFLAHALSLPRGWQSVLLNGSHTLECTDCIPRVAVICKLDEGSFHLLVQVIDKDTKQNRSQNRLYKNFSCIQSPNGRSTVELPVRLNNLADFYPCCGLPI